MYPIQSGSPFLVQQVVSGTGVFDGTEYGRTKATIPNGDPNAVVLLSSRLYGVASNNYTIAFLDAGPGVTVAATTVTQVGVAISVSLRRSAGALLATAAEVASAINVFFTGVAATYGGTGNGVVAALAATALNGGINTALGVDPSIAGPNNERYSWYLPTNSNAGHFYFENEETIIVRQFEAIFTVPAGTYTVTVSRMNLNDNLSEIAGETVPVYVYNGLTTARPDTAFSDLGILIQPRQALKVVTSGSFPGLVRFDVRKSARYPYL